MGLGVRPTLILQHTSFLIMKPEGRQSELQRKVHFANFQMILCLVDVSHHILIDFSHTVKAATLIFISRRGSAISCAKEGKSGFIYNLIKS